MIIDYIYELQTWLLKNLTCGFFENDNRYTVINPDGNEEDIWLFE